VATAATGARFRAERSASVLAEQDARAQAATAAKVTWPRMRSPPGAKIAKPRRRATIFCAPCHIRRRPFVLGPQGEIMRTPLALVLGVLLAANGVVMLVAPAPWYAATPGVPMTGPFNPHFVRDIGAAYLVSGGALAWFARRPEARPAALFAGLFLAIHALIHLADAIAGREAWRALLVDLPTVFLPPALALWLAWPRFKPGVSS
jgi:hypothetical protein